MFLVYFFSICVHGGYGGYPPLANVSLVCHFLSLTLYLWVLLEAPSQSQLLLLWKLDVHSIYAETYLTCNCSFYYKIVMATFLEMNIFFYLKGMVELACLM